MTAENVYVAMVESISVLCFNGQLPPISNKKLAGFIAAAMAETDIWKDQPDEKLQECGLNLVAAICDVRERLILARQVSEIVSPWTN